MPASSVEFLLRDASATDELGAALAAALPGAREERTVLYLEGDLGAGKTSCVRSLLRALGVTGLIRSPTYTMVEVYKLEALTCIHLDLYRLRSALEVEELGLRDYDDANHLLMIEWPGRGSGLLPAFDLDLSLRYLGNARTAHLTAGSVRGDRWLNKLADDASLTRYVTHLT